MKLCIQVCPRKIQSKNKGVEKEHAMAKANFMWKELCSVKRSKYWARQLTQALA